ncbi:ferritin family protein [Hyphomicrobium sp.]|jgi:rubrerythrin|uniref:ferritin-like domain-containing protein n=1 Tax=Hyphomicrobium sp. TaxID=82 RepID=UPI002B5C5DAF|nr:ferritin family protein [Hyphomicrobium sp.]HVZ03611.1 ferritin family protein [Hyphomicrobium sp.]
MPFLKSEPAGQIRTMSEFFALARAMETDAARRYTQTAQALRRQNASALADLFEELAKVELGHVEQVEEWAEHRATIGGTDAPWPIPDTFDASLEEIVQSNLMTPYRALASAVHHEQRSFAFWTYVAAHADGEVKKAAERMASEELEHISLLRRERRKAFHADRRRAGSAQATLATLATVERHLADLVGERAARGFKAAEIGPIATQSRDAAARLDALEKIARPKFSTVALPSNRENDIASLCEYLAEAYLRLAENSRNEQVLIAAQELAKSAISRLEKMNVLKLI